MCCGDLKIHYYLQLWLGSKKIQSEYERTLRWSFLTGCRWTYGGNRLQLQAETHLLEDSIRALEMIRHIGLDTIGSMKSLGPKHELLGMLLANEHTRLHVWLYPLESDKRLSFTSHHHSPAEVIIISI